MARNIIIAFVLIFLMLIFWNYILTRRTSEQQEQPTTPPVAEKEEVKEEPEAPKEVTPIKTAPEIEAALDTIDTPIYRAILSARGATIQNMALKEYKDSEGKNVELIRKGERALTDVINKDGELLDLKDAVFKVVERTPNSVVYSFDLPSGGTLLKEYNFADTSYMFSLSVTLPEVEKYKILWNAGLRFTESGRDELRFFSALAYLGGSVVSRELSKLKKEPYELQGGIDWVGTKNKYFLAAIVPDNVRTEKCSMMRFGTGTVMGGGGCCTPYAQCGGGGAPKEEDGDTQIGISLNTEYKSPMHYRIYVGPLDYDLLGKFGVGLQEACYLGFKWIRPISKFILTIFLGIYKVIHNYGIVIIVFALMISLVFFPLTRSQQKSMKGIAELQPKLQALQKKYKKDPQALNRATMELYRKHKVNPLGGCLPLLIQLPIFFAVYAILSSTIALRGTSFLWVPDLTQRDPIFVLPILMGATMLLNTRIQPQQQSQQKMLTYMMPIIFTFLFLSFPAGLVLYWLFYNGFSIIESYIIRRTL
jgi:YidC/Oxa1 family membrane protein insertase